MNDALNSALENLSDADFVVPVQEAAPAKQAEPTAQESNPTTPPAPTYEFSEEELTLVCDALMFEGGYEELFNIRGKFTFKLRTRSVQDVQDISMFLDKREFNMFSTFKQAEVTTMIAASIAEINGRNLRLLPLFPGDDAKGDTRLGQILKISAPLMSLIAKKLEYFDAKIYKAIQDSSEVF